MPIYILLIPFLPLFSFGFTFLLGKNLGTRCHWVPIISVLISFSCAVYALSQVIAGHRINMDLYTWIQSGAMSVSVGFLVDELTAVMLIVVTSISSLVHIYSVGYMKGEDGYYRFFSYLSLFTFSMLMLVLGNNMLQLFFGWEAVGLSSYLLIGFYYEKESAANAGKKAFIVNRFGDFGFILGLFLVYAVFGTLHYDPIFGDTSRLVGQSFVFLGQSYDLATIISLLLFCGAIGKSAQLPLHVWLPDAMEGPTPVSALIHAATMVTAGVFLVARCNPIFGLSTVALSVITIIGSLTCLFAALIALTQTDIKRVVAYSTVSQLAYMFIGCGVGAYGAGVFHLFTHAYFKALLFLGCGSIILGMHHEQDLKFMGGLRKYMPITYATFLLASLSISGVPGFAGFFSKDEILAMAFASHVPGAKFAWFIGTLVAGITAFYSFRLFFLVFHGTFRGTEEQRHHLQESPKVVTVPLLILAVGAIFSGWIGIPGVLGGGAHWSHFLEPVVGHPHHHPSHFTEIILMIISVGAGAIGIFLAYQFYMVRPEIPEKIKQRFYVLYTLSHKKFFVDELYNVLIVKPVLALSRIVVLGFCDKGVIEGIVNGVPQLIGQLSLLARRIQSGLISHYLAYITGGLVVLIIWMSRGV